MLVNDEVGEPVPLLEVAHAPAQLLVLADVVRSCLCTSTRALNEGSAFTFNTFNQDTMLNRH